MIFLLSVLAGTISGILLGGRPGNLLEFRLKHTWLLFVYLFLDVLFNRFFVDVLPLQETGGRPVVILLLCIQYSAFFMLVFLNHSRWPMLVLGAGEAMNFLVIIANGGRMPVDTTHLPENARLGALLSGAVPHYTALGPETRLPFLGDVIPVRFFSGSMMSPGDFIIMGGLFLLLLHATKNGTARKDAPSPV